MVSANGCFVDMAREPVITVGLKAIKGALHFELVGSFIANGDVRLPPGRYLARVDGGGVYLLGGESHAVSTHEPIRLSPEDSADSRMVVSQVPIGTGFHWHREQDLVFPGEFEIHPLGRRQLVLMNRLPLETYLASVIASEMSGQAPLEFLKAHAIISRSWALRRIREAEASDSARSIPDEASNHETTLRWTGAEVHQGFDVCADDHCQRYRGVSGRGDSRAERAAQETRGEVLTHSHEICDTRYSKCCGGMTEDFATAWDDRDVPYLRALPDSDVSPPGFSFPLSMEENARAWIGGSPEAFCRIRDQALIETFLPSLDQGTSSFYRWQTVYSQEEISETIAQKTGRHLGWIRDLLPLERGRSGRIARLRIVGTGGTLTVGKELEIRRVLSPTHLYSSAFFVVKEPPTGERVRRFRLIGAGWGHGVGLCQLGAAVMANRGKTYQEILRHYFPGTNLTGGYG
jgi:stage II sporulation protein D